MDFLDHINNQLNRNFNLLNKEIEIYFNEYNKYPRFYISKQWKQWNLWLTATHNVSLIRYIGNVFIDKWRIITKDLNIINQEIKDFYEKYKKYPNCDFSDSWKCVDVWLINNHKITLLKYIQHNIDPTYKTKIRTLEVLDVEIKEYKVKNHIYPRVNHSFEWRAWNYWLKNKHSITLSSYIKKYHNEKHIDSNISIKKRSLEILNIEIKLFYQNYNKYPLLKNGKRWVGWNIWLKDNHKITLFEYIKALNKNASI